MAVAVAVAQRPLRIIEGQDVDVADVGVVVGVRPPVVLVVPHVG